MILPDFVLHSRANQRWQYSGIDSIEYCSDKDYFQSYPYSIEYVYNSRGYRDAEWPTNLNDLKNAIWCVGDSFTVGIGQAFAHTWPQMLSTKIGCAVINVSLDGASNDWIVRKVRRIIEVINPKNIVVMWTYTHRRENPDINLNDEDRRVFATKASNEEDYLNWINLSNELTTLSQSIIQTTIPKFNNTHKQDQDLMPALEKHWSNIKGYAWPPCPTTLEELDHLPKFILNELKQVHCCYETFKTTIESQYRSHSVNFAAGTSLLSNNIIYCRQLDYARDGHHFDQLTAQWLVDQIYQQVVY
jgi:hypothetical protein